MSHPGQYASPEKNARSKDFCEQQDAVSGIITQFEVGKNGSGWHKTDTPAFGDCADSQPFGIESDLTGETENPGALAGATGADVDEENIHPNDTPKLPIVASGNGLRGEWSKVRWGWKRAVKRDARLSKTAKLIAVTLVDEFANHANGRCNPFIATLGEATGDPERTVQRALGDLEACGWIIRSKGNGRGRPSSITFTSDSAKGAIAPPNVSEITARHTDNRGADMSKGVPSVAPVRGAYRVPETAQKGVTGGGSHSEPRKNQKLRAYAQTPAGGASKIDRIPATHTQLPSRIPERPQLNLAAVAHHGSDRERVWDDWLRRRGFPKLVDLGVKSSDAEGRGWEIPCRYPPTEHNAVESMMAHRWATWATARMEACNVRA
ncbi:helix-turn-helix domain-containing protein [Neotabrizicola sp. VNH66]|uniref:helix-turn-helix domain-containing protein n=1 Tax=Neotabrizicola sp. VNH66 TaxID=3400918 RepID=UPI003BFC7230